MRSRYNSSVLPGRESPLPKGGSFFMRWRTPGERSAQRSAPLVQIFQILRVLTAITE